MWLQRMWPEQCGRVREPLLLLLLLLLLQAQHPLYTQAFPSCLRTQWILPSGSKMSFLPWRE